MFKTVNFHDFQDAFHRAGRNEQFSYEGKQKLFDYLEAYEDETGEKLELDVIELCCEYEESSVTDIAASYDIDIEGLDEREALYSVMEYLNDNTMVAGAVGEYAVLFQTF